MRREFLKKMARITMGVAVSTSFPIIGSAFASDVFPSKPVRIVYPFAAGGGMEVVLRVIASKMQKSTGQSFVIENRTGAGGSIAAQAAASAPADGYTLFVGPVGIMALTPHLRKLPYDTQKDLIPVARLSTFDGVMIVSSHLPVNTVEEFIAYAKANPGKLSYASAGIGSQLHVSGEMIQNGWGIKFNHIPYKGAADMVNDLVAGRLDVASDLTMLQYVKQGKAKLLTVFGDKRLDEFPNVPAIGELSVPQVNKRGTWFGAFAPKGTPPEVVNKLALEFEKALKDPDVIERMRPITITSAYLGPKDLKKIWDEDYKAYGEIIKVSGIKVE